RRPDLLRASRVFGGASNRGDSPRGRLLDRSHDARARGQALGPRLHIEAEFWAARPEFDGVLRQEVDLIGNPGAVQQRTVAAVQVPEPEGEIVALAPSNAN